MYEKSIISSIKAIDNKYSKYNRYAQVYVYFILMFMCSIWLTFSPNEILAKYDAPILLIALWFVYFLFAPFLYLVNVLMMSHHPCYKSPFRIITIVNLWYLGMVYMFTLFYMLGGGYCSIKVLLLSGIFLFTLPLQFIKFYNDSVVLQDTVDYVFDSIDTSALSQDDIKALKIEIRYAIIGILK